jgi:hypothetical protein
MTQSGVNYRHLVEQYPAHEFHIDMLEASELGFAVCAPESKLADILDDLRKYFSDLELFIGLIASDEEEETEQ